MPEITATTPRTTITIAGESFQVAQPYAAGHPLTSNEASSLNQTFAENIRNNFASNVKEAKDGPTFDLATLQGQLDDYVDGYEFGVRTGGGRTGDPVRMEAMNIARPLIRDSLRSQNYDMSAITAKQISELAAEAIDNGENQEIWDLAKQRVEAAKAANVGIKLKLPTPEAPAEGKTKKAPVEA